MIIRRETFPTFNSLFSDLFSDFSVGNGNQDYFMKKNPSTNILEEENKILIEMAIPGFLKEDFDINVKDNLLTIESKVKNQDEKSDDNYYLKEFEILDFKRSFTLADSIDSENINAKYEDGILRIELGKKERDENKKVRQISIS